MTLKTRATVEDLYREPGKAELVNGEIVRIAPAGEWPGYAGGEIYASLRDYAKQTRSGRAFGDNKAFCVSLPHRESFSPNAAFYVGKSSKMNFVAGARSSDPQHPKVYRRGETAEAEPAVPGWTMPVDDLFEPAD